MKRGGPLKQRSDKRVKEDAAFAKVRAGVVRRDRHCMRPIELGWCGGGLDVHHVVSRARDKTLALDPDNLITLCRRHHDWCHDHPLEATKLGLLRSAVPSPDPQKSQT